MKTPPGRTPLTNRAKYADLPSTGHFDEGNSVWGTFFFKDSQDTIIWKQYINIGEYFKWALLSGMYAIMNGSLLFPDIIITSIITTI